MDLLGFGRFGRIMNRLRLPYRYEMIKMSLNLKIYMHTPSTNSAHIHVFSVSTSKYDTNFRHLFMRIRLTYLIASGVTVLLFYDLLL